MHISSILLVILSLFVSCSKQSSNTSQVIEPPVEPFYMAEVRINPDAPTLSEDLNFGNLDLDKTYSVKIDITNRRPEPVQIQIDPLNYSIAPYVMNSFCNNVSLPSRKSCAVVLSLNTSGLSAGALPVQAINIAGQNINVLANVIAKPPVVLRVSENVGFNFGAVEQGASVSRELIVTNNFTSNENVNLDVSLLEGFSVSNGCSLQLLSRKSCKVTVSMDTSSLGLRSSSFSIGGNTINLQGSVIAPQPVVLSGLSPVSTSINGGQLFSGSKEIVVNYNNTSSQSISGLTVSGLVPPFSLKNNGCSTVAARKDCSIVLEVLATSLQQEAPYFATIKLQKDNISTPETTVQIQAEVRYNYNVSIKNFGNPEFADNTPLVFSRQEYRATLSPVANPPELTNFVAPSNIGRNQGIAYNSFLEVKNISTKQVAQMSPEPTPLSFNWNFSPSVFLFDANPTVTFGPRTVPACGHSSFSKTLAGNSSCATVARMFAQDEISAISDSSVRYSFGVSFGDAPAIQQRSVLIDLGKQVKNVTNKYSISLMRFLGTFDTFAGSETEAVGFLSRIDLDTKNITYIGTCDLNPSGVTELTYSNALNRSNPNKAMGLVPNRNSSAKYSMYKASNGKYYFKGKGCINNSGSRVMDANYSMWEYDPSLPYSIGVNPKKIFEQVNQNVAGFNIEESAPYIFFNSMGVSGGRNKILEYNSSNGAIHEISNGESVNIGGNGMVVHNSKLYFVTNTNRGNELLEYTPGSSSVATSLTAGISGVFSMRDDLSIVGVGNKLVFSASLDEHLKFKIYVFDISSNSLNTIGDSLYRLGRHMKSVGNNKVIMSAFVNSTSDAPTGEDAIVALDVNTLSHSHFNSNPAGRNLFHNNKIAIDSGFVTNPVFGAPDFHRPQNTEIAILNNKAYFRGNTGWFQSPEMAGTPGALNTYKEFGEISLFSYDSLTNTFAEESNFLSHMTGFVASRNCTSASAACYDLSGNTTATPCNSPFTCQGFQHSVIDDFPLSFIRPINGKLFFALRTMPPTGRATAMLNPSAPRTDQDPAQGGLSTFTNGGVNPMAKMKSALTQRFPFSSSNDSGVAPYGFADGRVFYPRNVYASSTDPIVFFDFLLGTDQNDMDTRIQINLEAPEAKAHQLVEIIDVIDK